MKIFRDYFRSYYERCCGHSRSGGVLHNSNLPLNLEMINNNHDQVEIMMIMMMMMMIMMMMVCRTSSRGSTSVWVTASTDTRPCGGRAGGRGSPGSRGRGASSRAADMTF